MKILFLDVDGVLNNAASAAEGIDLIAEKVLLVARICEETGASIVISSTWRKLYSLDVLSEMLRRVGLRSTPVIDVTPEFHNGHRGEEIQHWLDEHPDVTDFVIIDDDSDMLDKQKPFFVQTRWEMGLTTRCAKKAIAILKGEPHGNE